jgi:ketosteroid isomerase-like protein
MGSHRRDLDNFSVEPMQVLDAGDHVVVIGRSSSGVKSTGGAVTSEYAQVFGFRGGTAVKVRISVDPTETVRALEGHAVA